MKKLFVEHAVILLEKNQKLKFESFLLKNSSKETTYFSISYINKLVEEESKRDTSVIIEREGQALRSMSSGERKIAVLKYLLSLQPKVFVVDTIHENLDAKNLLLIDTLLREYSESGILVQLIIRETIPVLPNATHLIFKDDFLEAYHKKITSFFSKEKSAFAMVKIPETTTEYAYDYNLLVKLTDVTIKFFEKVVLKEINWEINLGEFWQLVGENGSGKTTLLSLITGDSHKAYGQNIILFDKLKGTEANVWEIKQKIGYFTPNITELFNRRHSVLHMVLSGFYDSIGLYVKPLDRHVILAKEWIELIGLTESMNSTFMTLPLSQQRMVLIARAMVKHPPLLILDEPTSGLDASSTQLIVSLINKIAQETKTTIIYVSHRMEAGLTPDKTYELSKTAEGSVGNIL